MIKKLFILLASVTSLILLCKPTLADETNNFWDSFDLGGYSSLNLQIPRDKYTEARVNELSLILRWENESRFKFFGEFELEYPLRWNSEHELTTRDAYFDLERLYIDYNLSDKLNLRVGRFLNPAGRWNLIHAAPLVWTTSRPLVTEQLFPSSINGLMLYGSAPMNDYAFEYTFFTELLKDQIKDGDETIYKHVNGAHFAITNGFNLGLTLASYREDEKSYNDYRLVGLDFVTHLKQLEVSGEAFARLTTKGDDGGSGAYLQTAYDLGNEWYWITRLETLEHPETGSGERWLIGATKRLKSNQLFKMEFIGGSNKNFETPNGFVASFAVLF